MVTRDARGFRFARDLTLGAPRERVHDVLLDLEWYAAWWPQVRAVARVDDDRALVVCRSVLPYDLDLLLTAVCRDPDRLEVALDGHLRGAVRFELEEVAPGSTEVRFRQQVEAVRPLLVAAARVARPVLVWNHEHMMRGFEDGLRRRLGC